MITSIAAFISLDESCESINEQSPLICRTMGELMNKQPEVTAATRQKLIDAFWECLAQSEIDKIAIKAIASKAGYGTVKILAHFPTA